MRAMLAKSGALLLLAAFGAGCTYQAAVLPLVSNKDIDAEPTLVTRGVEGESCVYRALGLIPTSGSWTPRVEDAMDDAMQGAKEGNVLTDVVLYSDITYAILFSKECLRVTGDLGTLR